MSEFIPISEIEVIQRQRKKLDPRKIEELAEDIKRNGLLHPLVVTKYREKWRLVAGERRMCALQNLHGVGDRIHHNGHDVPTHTAPCAILGGPNAAPDEIAVREAELSENIMRLDLTWQERTAAISELHALRSEQNPTQTQRDTAKELAASQGKEWNPQSDNKVSRSLIISEYLDDPDVASAPDETAAFRIVQGKLTELFNESLDRTELEPVTPHKLLAGDARELMLQLPENYYACVVSDPPYGISADQFGKGLKHGYSDTADELLYYAGLASSLTRICTSDAHVYLFCDVVHFNAIARWFIEKEWRVREKPLIWFKGVQGYNPEGNAPSWRRTYECILVARRGDRRYARLSPDVITDCQQSGTKEHAAQKPVDLYKRLLSMSCDVGEEVLDPFCGSGPIFDAATDLGLVATGIELESKSLSICETLRGVYRSDG